MTDDPSAGPGEPPSALQVARRRIRDLEAQLEDSQELLDAIRHGEIDAVVVRENSAEDRIYTLENADRPYRILIEEIQEGAVTLGLDGTIFYCNRRLADMVGLPQQKVIGQSLGDFLRQDGAESFATLLGAARKGQARREFAIGRVDGGMLPVNVTLSPMVRDGDAPLLCGVVADLSQQKLHLQALSDANARLIAESAHREAAEEALRQSQKMEAVGQLTGGLAHDFNNLLTGIIGSLDLMQRRLARGRLDDLPRFMTAAMTSANRAAALTHRLLAFSRRQTLDPKLVDVNVLVAGMEDLLRRTVGPTIAVKSDLFPSVGAVLCDANQLENALLNLAINARDAMPDGGDLTISTGNVDLQGTFAIQRDMPPGDYVSVSITDTGRGMTPDVVLRAFDPFFTTKPIGQGTGLGLSMIYGFAKQSGGQVRIHSREGIGTTVRIYLPRDAGAVYAAATLEAVEAPRPQAQQGETVLVVDDEAAVRLLVVEVLHDLGYVTREAEDGPTGLRALESAGRIDLLVTDVGLPNGMNGRQLADAARARRPDLKVLFITGFAETVAVREGVMEAGMEVLTKPFSIDALAGKIRTMIGRTATVDPRREDT